MHLTSREPIHPLNNEVENSNDRFQRYPDNGSEYYDRGDVDSDRVTDDEESDGNLNVANTENNLENDIHKEEITKSPVKKKTYILYFVTITITLICSINIYKPSSTCTKVDIDHLQTNFKFQPHETWESIDVIIDDVLSTPPIHPAVFLFLFDRNGKNISEMIDSIAQFALHKMKITGEHINITEKEFLSPEVLADYGYLIHKYKPALTEKKVMVIKDIQKMPAKVAQALHSFCDEFEPLVEQAVYILTLKVNSLNGREVQLAEEFLKKQWSDLDSDILMPLIARITSTVMKIF